MKKSGFGKHVYEKGWASPIILNTCQAGPLELFQDNHGFLKDMDSIWS